MALEGNLPDGSKKGLRFEALNQILDKETHGEIPPVPDNFAQQEPKKETPTVIEPKDAKEIETHLKKLREAGM